MFDTNNSTAKNSLYVNNKHGYDAFNESSILRNLLFVCDKCSGPTVPNASCIICKKYSVRSCVKCYSNVFVEKHQKCLVLINYLHKLKNK